MTIGHTLPAPPSTLRAVLTAAANTATVMRLHMACVHGDPSALNENSDAQVFADHHHAHAAGRAAVGHPESRIPWTENDVRDTLAELDVEVRDQLTTVLDTQLETLAARQANR